jgi:perosamine synthetase
VPIIEDAAEALGSTCRGRAAGRLGAAGVLSFNGNKIITPGGGGMVVTDDVELAARARHLSTQARSDPLRYEHDAIGFNYRLPNLNAALGLAQLERLDELLAAKRRIADGYAAAFGGVEGVELLAEQPWAHSNHWLVAALLPVGERDPDAVLARCDALGVEARRFFVPAHELPMYRQCPRGSLEVTDDLGARGVNLPSSPDLDATAPAVIAERLAEALAGVGTS